MGSGAFGEVVVYEEKLGGGYLVSDDPAGQPKTYAVKIVKTEGRSAKETLRLATMLQREVEISQKLSHPGLRQIYDSFVYREQFWLIMELVRGQSVHDRLMAQQCPLKEEEAKSVFREVADALRYTHSHDVIHRDVKPANVILEFVPAGAARSSNKQPGTARSSSDEQRGAARGSSQETPGAAASHQEPPGGATSSQECWPYRAKLVDFGLAKDLSEGDAKTKRIGTPRFMAPELLSRTEAPLSAPDKQVDVYSLGATVLQMVGGKPVEADRMPIEDLDNRHMQDGVFKRVSKECGQLTLLLLRADPKERISLDKALRHPWVRGGADSG